MTDDNPLGVSRRLRLRRVRIRGFKALADMDLRVPSDILILIGGNGAGKSSILQALAFVQYVAKGQPSAFFSDRIWDPTDIRTQIRTPLRTGIISYRLLLEDQEGLKIYWHFYWHLAKSRMEHEEVWVRQSGAPDPVRILRVSAKNLIEIGSVKITGIRPEGSLIGLVDPDTTPPEVYENLSAVHRWGSGIFSLELLSPVDMRRGARGTPSDIGPRGERLGGFLASLKPDQKNRLVTRLAAFYPLKDLDTKRKRAGWVDLSVAEKFEGVGRIAATHMSDGFMRLLGLASIPEFGGAASTVLLDEAEDGIEPHVLPNFIRLVSRESDVQLIVTSHSPILVNAFEPSEIAFVARDGEGRTQVASFVSIHDFNAGLQYFGPGELWTNTEISAINRWVLDSITHADVKDPVTSVQRQAAVMNFMDGR
jgi:hypothetical protein